MTPDALSLSSAEQAVQKGLAFIDEAQLPSGGFESFSSPTRSPFRSNRAYRTTFVPALILAALSQIDSPGALNIRHQLAGWLIKQKSPGWSFNYWAKEAPQRQALPYPDDLDDTFCALIGLYLHQPVLIDPTCLAKTVQLLLATETKVGGPYRTWLIPAEQPVEKQWRDIDLAVNANIACFLGWVAEPLPNVTKLLDRAIDKNRLSSPYYPSSYPITYYLSRAPHGRRARLIRLVLDRKRHGHWGTPMHTALAATALLRLGHQQSSPQAISYLLKTQGPDGSWAAEAFCSDPSIDGKAYYNGSAALTTALVVESLSMWLNQSTKEPQVKSKTDARAQRVRSLVWDTARQQLSTLDSVLKRTSLTVLDDTKQRDYRNEIALLPLYFARSLQDDPRITNDVLANLGLANVYGWMAYTIYDDFLDGEGDPTLLSVANIAMRNSLASFRRSLPNSGVFQHKVLRTFDQIDAANAWEVARCRLEIRDQAIVIRSLPRYGRAVRLAERSLGHVLTPLGVLAAADLSLDSAPARHLESSLKHYLIARQLNDDLHDWEEDVRAGRCSYVVARILQDLKLPPGNQQVARLLPRMQQQFWRHSLTALDAIISQHTAAARQAATRSKLLHPTNVITTLLDAIDASVQHTQTEQQKADAFLAAYKTGRNQP